MHGWIRLCAVARWTALRALFPALLLSLLCLPALSQQAPTPAEQPPAVAQQPALPVQQPATPTQPPAAAAQQAQPPAAEAPPPATIVVFGDSQAQGLTRGLQRVLLEDSRFRLLNRTHPGAALVHDEGEWLKPIERFASSEKADIAIVMFGANDRLDMREGRATLRFRSDEWRVTYAARADKVLALLAKAGLRVMWLGNPIARSPTYSADMSYINDIYVEGTARYGFQFMPLWTVIADPQGQYTAYGKDRSGVTQRLRGDDGIHFTSAGYELIAEKIIGLLSASAANAR